MKMIRNGICASSRDFTWNGFILWISPHLPQYAPHWPRPRTLNLLKCFWLPLSLHPLVPLHVISWSRDFTWNGLILGISRDHGMKITWNHVIFTWNQALGISWFHVMRMFVKFRGSINVIITTCYTYWMFKVRTNGPKMPSHKESFLGNSNLRFLQLQ